MPFTLDFDETSCYNKSFCLVGVDSSAPHISLIEESGSTTHVWANEQPTSPHSSFAEKSAISTASATDLSNPPPQVSECAFSKANGYENADESPVFQERNEPRYDTKAILSGIRYMIRKLSPIPRSLKRKFGCSMNKNAEFGKGTGFLS